MRIPVFRRDIGGGAVYLDGEQLFFQLILYRNNPAVPSGKGPFYRKFLKPVLDVYRRIGIAADYKPVNDIVVGGRKISGTGAGEIEDFIVFVGNLIVDFNYEMMSRVLKVPDEKFRDKVYKSLTSNLTTIRRELGNAAQEWSEDRLNAMLSEAFQHLLGPMDAAGIDEPLREEVNRLREWMTADEWLLQKRRKRTGRDVVIRSGARILHRVHKAKGGLIRADFEVSDGRFRQLAISGDFFCFPKEAISLLESILEERPVEEAMVVLGEFYARGEVETPGIGVEDWMAVLTE